MLQKKTKKWLTRLGAGMLLGLSIFNLGSSFGQDNTSVPKSAGNFRRKEDANVNPEMKGMMKTAEEEARLVLSQQGKVFANSERENLSLGQTFLRFGVVSVWVVSAGIVFTSLMFNLPFALGRVVLSALPGTAHTAVLKLTANKEVFLPGEKIDLTLALESGEKVSSMKAFLQYPQGTFFLDGVDSQFLHQVNVQPDGLEIVFDNLQNKTFSTKDSLAKISFLIADQAEGQSAEAPKVELSWDKSLVLSVKNGKEKERNLLGKTISPQFALNFDQTPTIFCQKAAGDPAAENFWQEWLVSSPVGRENDKWNQLSADWSLGCVLGENKAGLILVGNQKIDSFLLEKKTGQKEQKPLSFHWQTGATFFQAIDLEKAEIENGVQGWKLSLAGANLNFSWPMSGMAAVSIVENKK